jgi:hypothetical protein
MARYILCERCDNTLSESSKKYGELYESIEGIAIKDMFCDGACGDSEATPIKKGDKCFAAVLLPSISHQNYKFHKPKVWMSDFVISKPITNE